MSSLEESVLSALRESGLARGAGLLLAVSGGPDSTALLRAVAARRDALALSLSACIVDHGIRTGPEIEAEETFVRRLCDDHAVALVVQRVPPGQCRAQARETGRGLEEVAREARHRLLREAAARVNASMIALGHTEDDVVETLLMRLLQGSGVEGLRGIPFRRGPFVRPLLRCTREQVIAYLSSLGQDWREDPSNRDTTILRNRIRHLLLPVLRESFPGHRAGLLTLRQRLLPLSDLLRGMAAALSWRSGGGGFTIGRAEFFASPPAVRSSSLLQLYDSFRGPDSPRRLPLRFLGPAMGEDRQGDGWVVKGHGTGLVARGGELFWGPCLVSRG